MALAIGSVTKGLGQMIKSPEVIAVASSVFITPIVQPFVASIIGKIPFLRQHLTIGLVLAGLLIFILASRIKAGFLRAIIIGVAGSLFIIGVAPVINKFVRR